MRKSIEDTCATYTCPQCELTLHSSRGGEGLRLNYDIAHWQQRCIAPKLGTPCVCPRFRPSLWKLLSQANRLAKSR